MIDEAKFAKLQDELNLYKLKAHRRRQAIKDLIRSNNMIRACWHKEIALNRALRAEHHDANKYFWRFAKFCSEKLNANYENLSKIRAIEGVRILVREFELFDQFSVRGEDK